MTKPKFRYSCVDCPDIDELNYIDNHQKEITLRTLRRNVDQEDLRNWERNFGYGRYLPLAKDWHVRFHKSRLPDGRLVYFIMWSCTHFVFYSDREVKENATRR